MIGFLEIIIAFIAIALSIVAYFKSSYKYWEKKNVPYIQPTIPWGTNENPIRLTKSFSLLMKDFYDELKSKGHKFGGLYLITKPAVLLIDPDLIKRVLVADFSNFTSRGTKTDDEKHPTRANLAMLDGEKWRNMRVKLTPTFTSGKMKMMFNTLLVCGEPMIDYINNLTMQAKSLDIKEILACFTTDVIGSCAFGIECNSFKEPDAEFRKYGKKLFQPTWRTNLLRVLSFILPNVGFGRSKETENFFINSFKNIVNYREKNDLKRNDFVQMLLELKRKADSSGGKDTFTLEQMVAQSFVFFAAGFETSSTTMTFCLHELAHNLDIQKKLRKEINATMQKYDGKLTYDGIMEMKYLNMVVEETLRKYPPASVLSRICEKEYTIKETGTVIEPETRVFISNIGLHRDPEYYPDPEKFDPDRFCDENKAKRPQFTYLPFGEGPRICIGLRFGLMQTKVGLSLILKNFILTPHESTRYKMAFQKNAIILSFKDDLLLNAQRIN